MKSIVLFFLLLAFCLNSPLIAQHTSNLAFNDSLAVNINLPFKYSVKRFEVKRSNRPENIGFKIPDYNGLR